jgi:hypothetical protein
MPYKDYSSLNRCQDNRDLLSRFTYAIYYYVMTYLKKGKKVNILPSGDVNLRSVPSRQSLLEDNLYHVVGVACLSFD